MPTLKKEQELALLEDKFQRSKALVFTDFRGLNAQEMVELRRLFRKSDLEYRVVKNTLARLAAERTGLAVQQFLVGPTGVLIGYSDGVLPFKLATEVAKRYKRYAIKGGLLEGRIVQPAEAAQIAALPSREELLTRLAFVLQAPIQKLASDLSGIIRRLAMALEAVRREREKAEAQAASQAEPAETESAEENRQNKEEGQMDKEEILTTIDQMTVKELAELVEAIEERYKVSAQAVAPVAVAAAPATPGAAVAEEKTAFKVTLKNAGQQKIQLIKLIKELTGKGLKESKALVDTLPAVVKEGLSEEEARSLKAKLEEVGAEVELQ